jgi:hypothetical protein
VDAPESTSVKRPWWAVGQSVGFCWTVVGICVAQAALQITDVIISGGRWFNFALLIPFVALGIFSVASLRRVYRIRREQPVGELPERSSARRR